MTLAYEYLKLMRGMIAGLACMGDTCAVFLALILKLVVQAQLVALSPGFTTIIETALPDRTERLNGRRG